MNDDDDAQAEGNQEEVVTTSMVPTDMHMVFSDNDTSTARGLIIVSLSLLIGRKYIDK